MSVFPVDREKAMHIFNNQLQLIKDRKRPDKQEGGTKFIDMLNDIRNRKQLKMRDLEEEVEVLRRSVHGLEKEQDEVNGHLQKESMRISQEEMLVNEMAQKVQVLNGYKKEYIQRMAKASSKVSVKDQQLLDTYKQKLQAYKKLTGVMFDYSSCTDNKISGYIRDDDDRKLKMFHLDIKGKAREAAVEEFWNLLQLKNNNSIS